LESFLPGPQNLSTNVKIITVKNKISGFFS
jgi:hypothetical protein